jgi:small subunit ribosomal protein S6
MAMRSYEFALILTEEAGKDDKKIKSLVETLLLKVKAKLTKINTVGKRDLAYAIKKNTKGVYCFCQIELAETEVNELDKLTKHSDSVIRYLLMRRDHVEPIVK